MLCSSDHMTCMEGSGTVLNQDSSHGIIPLVCDFSSYFFLLSGIQMEMLTGLQAWQP